MRLLLLVVATVPLTGCTIGRQQDAMDAQRQMVGMTRPAVLACMGAPASRAEAGDVEAWAYSATGDSTAFAMPAGPGFAAFGRQARCTVNVMFSGPTVSRVAYNAGGSGFLVPEESCAPLVKACLAAPR